jgi:hypothetical protein
VKSSGRKLECGQAKSSGSQKHECGFLGLFAIFFVDSRQLHTSGSRGISCVDVCKTRVVVFDVEEEVEEEDGEEDGDDSD